VGKETQTVLDYWKWLKKKPNVVGIDGKLKPKIRKGKTYRNIKSLRIYVSKKIDLKDVIYAPSIWQKIKHKFRKNPEMLASDLVPSFVDGIPTDLVVIGEIRAPRPSQKSNKSLFRPVKAGSSSMHYQGTACTTNGFFKDPKTDKVFIVSNNHCFAKENKAKVGDAIIQPSPFDGGKYPQDIIGKLSKFVPIQFNHFSCPFRRTLHKLMFWKSLPVNKVDIAFAEILVPWVAEATYIGPFKGKRLPREGERVQKTGRTTEYTTGKVVSLHWTGSVTYSRGLATFTDCILVEGRGFSKGGDSGSPVFDMEGNYLGALFAGSDTHAIICKYSNIEQESGMVLILKKEN